MATQFTRREWLRSTAAAAVAFGTAGKLRAAEPAGDFPPARVITRGPQHHWFGYYDKLEFDPTGRYVLGMQVDFEHRSPRPDDVIRVGMVDLQENDRWIELGTSTAWCWQQGCMLQWIPGSENEVLWNDREEGRYVCRILNVRTGKQRTVPAPVYAISPEGRTAISTDFCRLADTRPGYGYNGFPDPWADDLAPEKSGIWKTDLETGQTGLIITLRDIAGMGMLPGDISDGAKHWFNHLLFNTDGSRFVFLHRWGPPGGRRLTRMITADPDGSNLHILDDNGLTSHFIWRDPLHILAFSKPSFHGPGFYLFEDRTRNHELIGKDVMIRDGHCSYLPGNEWILNDTYPDKDRNQIPYLYHVKSGRMVPLGHFRLPPEYRGEWRCDTHPRFSPDGRTVVIDSPHQDQGRQLHLIDISRIVG